MASNVHSELPRSGGLNEQDPEHVIWGMVYENCVRDAEAKALERSLQSQGRRR